MEEILRICGLTHTEQQILDQLSIYGQMLASSIARKTGIKRPTVYAALNKLTDEGFVIKVLRKQSTFFTLVDADVLKKMLTSQATSQYKGKLQAIDELAIFLKNKKILQKQSISGFEISMIEKSELIYLGVASAFKSSKKIKSVFNPQLAITNSRSKKITSEFLEHSKRNGTQIQEIVISGASANWYLKQISNPNHVVKEISQASEILTDFIIADNELYFAKYDNSEGAGIKIMRDDLLVTMNTIFDLLWERL